MARRTPPPAGRELILVDGYNLIFRHPELRTMARADLERARGELVRRIAAAALGGAGQVLVVFDGRDAGAGLRTRGAGKVRVVFSGPGETADQRIQKLIEGARGAPGGASAVAAFRVVSSDREVAGRAQLWGARVTSGEAFLAELGGGGSAPKPLRPKPAPLGDQEIAEWERIFRRRLPGEPDDEGGGGGGGGGGGRGGRR